MVESRDITPAFRSFSVIAIISLTILPWPEDSEQTLRFSELGGRLPSVQLTTSHSEGFTLSLMILNVKQKAVIVNVCSLWFDPIGNRTRVHRFSNRGFIYYTTNRLMLMLPRLGQYKLHLRDNRRHWSIQESICL